MGSLSLSVGAVVKGKDIAKQITDAGGKAIAVSGDVTDLSFPERLIEETVKYVFFCL
jgi:hypothetical protein